MKQTLLLLAMSLAALGSYAQDDDVYFVPSSKNEVSTPSASTPGRHSYTPETNGSADAYDHSSWADGRGTGGRDVDDYNRRGRNYKQHVEATDSDSPQDLYDQGYDDGYEDGSYTARIVRFWSPRPGVYVSSPYYLDYYDLAYDPWYYGYGSPWSWGWSGWYGWGSWYGWRPYYSWSWGWGWHGGWYDPWWGGPYWGWNGGWRPGHWIPDGAQRGPVGGWIAYSGRRGYGGVTNTTGRNSITTGRTSLGRTSWGAGNGRGTSRNFGFNRNDSRTPSTGTSTGRGTSRLARIFGVGGSGNNNSSTNNRAPQRTFNTPSRSDSRSFGGSGTFSAPSRSSFGGGVSGGGRSFGGGGGGSRSFGGRR